MNQRQARQRVALVAYLLLDAGAISTESSFCPPDCSAADEARIKAALDALMRELADRAGPAFDEHFARLKAGLKRREKGEDDDV